MEPKKADLDLASILIELYNKSSLMMMDEAKEIKFIKTELEKKQRGLSIQAIAQKRRMIEYIALEAAECEALLEDKKSANLDEIKKKYELIRSRYGPSDTEFAVLRTLGKLIVDRLLGNQSNGDSNSSSSSSNGKKKRIMNSSDTDNSKFVHVQFDGEEIETRPIEANEVVGYMFDFMKNQQNEMNQLITSQNELKKVISELKLSITELKNQQTTTIQSGDNNGITHRNEAPRQMDGTIESPEYLSFLTQLRNI